MAKELNMHEVEYILGLPAEKRTGYQWITLLHLDEKKYAELLPWDDLNINHWYYILKELPHFADRFDKWDQFTEFDWPWLLIYQPQFAEKCKWSGWSDAQRRHAATAQPDIFRFLERKKAASAKKSASAPKAAAAAKKTTATKKTAKKK